MLFMFLIVLYYCLHLCLACCPLVLVLLCTLSQITGLFIFAGGERGFFFFWNLCVYYTKLSLISVSSLRPLFQILCADEKRWWANRLHTLKIQIHCNWIIYIRINRHESTGELIYNHAEGVHHWVISSAWGSPYDNKKYHRSAWECVITREWAPYSHQSIQSIWTSIGWQRPLRRITPLYKAT